MGNSWSLIKDPMTFYKHTPLQIVYISKNDWIPLPALWGTAFFSCIVNPRVSHSITGYLFFSYCTMEGNSEYTNHMCGPWQCIKLCCNVFELAVKNVSVFFENVSQILACSLNVCYTLHYALNKCWNEQSFFSSSCRH